MQIHLQTQSALWDKALLGLRQIDYDPEPEVLAFLDRGTEQIGRRGLDTGCGFGRHTLAALQRGYEVTAVDLSTLAVNKTRELVRSHGFQADVRCASMHELPFEDAEFDFSFSWCVLNHGTRELFCLAVKESMRVLRPSGCSFGFVMSANDSRYGKGIKVEEDCFVFTEGPEKGLYHYFPSKEELLSLLESCGRVEELREVRTSEASNEFYHPQMLRSSHFAFVVRKI